MSGPDLDRLVAIDVHVHVEADGHGHYALDDELRAAASKYFKGDPYHPTVPQIAADYRKLSMAAVIFTVDAEAATGPASRSTRSAPASTAPSSANTAIPSLSPRCPASPPWGASPQPARSEDPRCSSHRPPRTS